MGPSGLEPLTFAMSTQRSNQLSYEPAHKLNGQEGSRTLTTLRPTDFKSVVYAIPPLALNNFSKIFRRRADSNR